MPPRAPTLDLADDGGMDLTVHVRNAPGNRPTDILIRTSIDGTISVHARPRPLVDITPEDAPTEPEEAARPNWRGRLLGPGGR